MKKILIISTSRDEQKLIEEVNALGMKPDYVVHTTASFGQDASWWVENAPDVLIVRFPNNDPELEKHFAAKILADVPVDLPMIYLSENISNLMMQIGQKLKKVRMIKLPISGADLFKVIQDVTTDFGPGKNQVHPRYLTNQPALISSDYSTVKMNSIMKNLSLGGAYLEATENTLNLKPGDYLKFSISLGSPKKQYVFDAKVMWVKITADSQHGFGVSFVDKEEVYNHLLKGL